MHTMRRAAEGPQCPEYFPQNAAPRKNSPDVGGTSAGLTTAPTGAARREVHHG